MHEHLMNNATSSPVFTLIQEGLAGNSGAGMYVQEAFGREV
jgi:hypothetical protein